MSGRPFLQIPGPTNVPERVLRAMDRSVIDHRSPEFAELTQAVRSGLRAIFGTVEGVPMLYPASGTGATEAAIVNVFAPGDRVLVYNYGLFGAGLATIARRFGLEVDEVMLRYGQDLPPDDLEARLRADNPTRPYRGVLVVHNETSTGVTVDLAAIRAAMDAAGHDALLVVDTVSSLGCMDFRQDDWRVDIALCGSQKGLMLPPGLGILCVGPRGLALAERGGSPRHFWDWGPIVRENRFGLFPYTPATLMLFGLREALTMLVHEEGLEKVFARHARLAEGVRAAVRGWGLPIVCEQPANYSNSITAVRVPPGFDSNRLITHAHDRYNLALGSGIGQLGGGVAFRLGHLGSLNELEVLAMIGGTELAFADLGLSVAEPGSGLLAAQRTFLSAAAPVERADGRPKAVLAPSGECCASPSTSGS
jgi:alanine-glyoxylate transaminase / serine-glyoxylate transaminase / serine-pyruvate transaminase